MAFDRLCRESQLKPEFAQDFSLEWCSRALQQIDHRDDSNSAGRSKAYEVPTFCFKNPSAADRDALWQSIKTELHFFVRLPGVLCEPMLQLETGSKGQRKQIHRLLKGEQSLFAVIPRDKTSGASSKLDVQ